MSHHFRGLPNSNDSPICSFLFWQQILICKVTKKLSSAKLIPPVYFDGFIRKKANGEAHYSPYSDDLMHSYPDFKFFVVDINTTSKGDTLSNNLQNAVNLSFKVIESLELNFKKKISEKEKNKRIDEIAPQFNTAKDLLTQEEKEYVDRLTQALTYNFLYAE